MQFSTISEVSERWSLSERSVRNYCALGRIQGAVLDGKTWLIPSTAKKPDRKPRARKISTSLLDRLLTEKANAIPGGIYHKIQIEMTYNSNHIEGSRLSHEQTRFIFETNTIGMQHEPTNVDDIIETANHFRCIDAVIDHAKYNLSETFIKQLHFMLKSGTSDSRKSWFAVGEYKRLANEVGGTETTPPHKVAAQMQSLIRTYNAKKSVTLTDILDFHHRFEKIHPFQDGNGRVGRLLMLKECLRYNVVPFIIDDDLKLYYYRGLANWQDEQGYLLDTCRTGQDRFKVWLDYFGLEYEDA